VERRRGSRARAKTRTSKSRGFPRRDRLTRWPFCSFTAGGRSRLPRASTEVRDEDVSSFGGGGPGCAGACGRPARSFPTPRRPEVGWVTEWYSPERVGAPDKQTTVDVAWMSPFSPRRDRGTHPLGRRLRLDRRPTLRADAADVTRQVVAAAGTMADPAALASTAYESNGPHQHGSQFTRSTMALPSGPVDWRAAGPGT